MRTTTKLKTEVFSRISNCFFSCFVTVSDRSRADCWIQFVPYMKKWANNFFVFSLSLNCFWLSFFIFFSVHKIFQWKRQKFNYKLIAIRVHKILCGNIGDNRQLLDTTYASRNSILCHSEQIKSKSKERSFYVYDLWKIV